MAVEAGAAVVTAAAAGLGRHIADALAARGRDVVLIDRDPDALSDVRRSLEARFPGQVRTRVCDLASADAVRSLGAELAVGRPLDLLVNNAGAWTPGDQYPDASADAWWSTMTLNLLTPMLLTQSLWPVLAKAHGAVVNIGSSGGNGDEAYGSPEYGASKAGLRRFTAALGDRTDVRVMAVVPEWIALERAIAEWRAMSARERADAERLVPPERLVDVILDLVDHGRPGQVVDVPGSWVPAE